MKRSLTALGLADRRARRRRRLVRLQQAAVTPGHGGTAAPARFGHRALRRARHPAHPRRKRNRPVPRPRLRPRPGPAVPDGSPAPPRPWRTGRSAGAETARHRQADAQPAHSRTRRNLPREPGQTIAGLHRHASLSGRHQPVSGQLTPNPWSSMYWAFPSARSRPRTPSASPVTWPTALPRRFAPNPC